MLHWAPQVLQKCEKYYKDLDLFSFLAVTPTENLQILRWQTMGGNQLYPLMVANNGWKLRIPADGRTANSTFQGDKQ